MKMLLGPTIGLSIGAFVLSLLALAFGEHPFQVFSVLYRSVFGSMYDFGSMLAGAVPLIFTGLAVSLPLRAGLFNVGAEGQLLVGALFSYGLLRALPPLPSEVVAPLSFVLCLLGGALWGGVAGILKSWRNSHEVVVTIMLNYVAYALIAWAVSGPWKNFESSMAETLDYGHAYRRIPFPLFDGAPLGVEVLVCLLIVALLHTLVSKTLWGFHLKAWGQNPVAASLGCVQGPKYIRTSMALGGALAGAAVWSTLAAEGVLTLNLSSHYGFTGIAVALLAKGHPLAVVPSAVLFSILNKGAADFDLEFKYLTHDAIFLVQGAIILSVGAHHLKIINYLKKTFYHFFHRRHHV